jgi:hypothetical protein
MRSTARSALSAAAACSANTRGRWFPNDSPLNVTTKHANHLN